MRGIIDGLVEKYTDIYYLGCPNSAKHPVKNPGVDPFLCLNYLSTIREDEKPIGFYWKTL